MLPKILVVDDWRPNLLLVESYLKGVEVDTTTSLISTDVKAMVDKEEYALFILDVQMPNLDGFELAKESLKSKKAYDSFKKLKK